MWLTMIFYEEVGLLSALWGAFHAQCPDEDLIVFREEDAAYPLCSTAHVHSFSYSFVHGPLLNAGISLAHGALLFGEAPLEGQAKVIQSEVELLSRSHFDFPVAPSRGVGVDNVAMRLRYGGVGQGVAGTVRVGSH